MKWTEMELIKDSFLTFSVVPVWKKSLISYKQSQACSKYLKLTNTLQSPFSCD